MRIRTQAEIHNATMRALADEREARAAREAREAHEDDRMIQTLEARAWAMDMGTPTRAQLDAECERARWGA